MPTRFYKVPAGTKPHQCTGAALGGTCRARIYWIHQGGRAVPVDCAVEDGNAPSENKLTGQLDAFGADTTPKDGRGVSHFDTCPDAELFRRGARAQ